MNQFICGECLEEMAKLPENSIDFIFTSPPYADQVKDYGATGVRIKPNQFDDWFLPRAREMFRIFISKEISRLIAIHKKPGVSISNTISSNKRLQMKS